MYVGELVGKLPAPHVRREDPALVDSETMLGVEVEVERVGASSLPSLEKDSRAGYWTYTDDGSLRNHGKEFIFSSPLYGHDVIQALDYLFTLAKRHKWVISERTGIHVHVDVRGMDLGKFQNFCILYALMEPLIYNWVGDERDANIHCLPWYAADADLENIAGIFKHQSSPSTVRDRVRGLHRYSGLNLNSLDKFGTAEFRHLKTTFDRDRMITWLNIILSLKKAAQAWQGSPEDLVREVQAIKPYAFVHKVFGPELQALLWYPDFLTHCRGVGVPVASQILEYSSTNTRKIGDVRDMFKRIRKNGEIEQGEHPGLAAWRKKRNASHGEAVEETAPVGPPHLSTMTWGQGQSALQPPPLDAWQFITLSNNS